MAKSVIDLFEAVQVYEHDCDLGGRPVRERGRPVPECGRQLFGKEHPVGQAGQGVVMSLVLANGDFTPKSLEQVAAAEGHAGVGGQGFEEPEVGALEALVAERTVGEEQVARPGILPLERRHQSLAEPSLVHGASNGRIFWVRSQQQRASSCHQEVESGRRRSFFKTRACLPVQRTPQDQTLHWCIERQDQLGPAGR